MNDPCRDLHSTWRLDDLLESHPELNVSFLPRCELRIEGALTFRAVKDGFEQIEDTYLVRIEVPADFPESPPKAFETGERIPPDYHKFRDESLCLGSPLRQRLLIAKEPTLWGFAERLLIPYLYNRSYYEKNEELPIGELDHGAPGLVADYENIFKTGGAKACAEMLALLGLHKRIANKRPCPCGSGRRLGKCHNMVLNPLRKLALRREYREQLQLLLSQIEAEKRSK